MKKKVKFTKGFSLAEMMIVMLIISIVLAASGPMLAKREEKILTGSVPAGTIITYAGSITILNPIPTGWLLCDGRAVSRTDFASLFSAIGTTYGAGNGSTTFNLPDLRGRATIGMDNLGGTSANRVTAATADTLGGSGGEELHTLTTAEMPSHSHSGTAVSAGYHTHSGSSSPAGAHTHSGSTSASGSHSHYYEEFCPETPGVTSGALYCIASQCNNIVHRHKNSWTTAPAGDHSHSMSLNPVGDHSHSMSINGTGDHTHTVSIGDAGSGSAHNNVPPYIALNYIIKY